MMQYDSLFNNPVERRRVTYPFVWWDNGFTDEELITIEDICGKEPLERATTVGEKSEEDTNKIRKSKLKFFDRNDETDFIFSRFNYIGQSLNNQFYNFNLNGYKSFQYTVYDSKDEGNYGWHMDTILGSGLDETWKDETRKLTMVLLLSEPGVDFTGGEFQINLGNESNASTPDFFKGRVLAFPSFMIHQVKPVLTGIRKSIVVWIEGPKFI